MKPKMKAFRERQAALGNKPRTLYMTDTEFETIKLALAKLRAQGGIVNPNKAKPIPEATQPAPVSNPVAEADPEPDITEPENEHLVRLNQMALAFKAEGLCLDPEEEAVIALLAKTDPDMAVARRAFAEDGARAYAKSMSKVESKTEEIIPPTPEDQAELEALLEDVGRTYSSGGGIFKGDGKIPKPLEEQLEDFFA